MQQGIPLQKDCDMTDPEEALVWALIDLPTPGAAGPTAGGFTVDKRTARAWSKELWERGLRFVPDKQEKFYHPPAVDSWWGATAGTWSNEPPRQVDGVEEVVASMTPMQRAELRARLDEVEATSAEPSTTSPEGGESESDVATPAGGWVEDPEEEVG